MLWEEKHLSNADIARIVKLGLYIDYNNKISFNNDVKVNKKNLNQILQLVNITFEKFFRTMLDSNIFYTTDLTGYKTYNLWLQETVWHNLILNKEMMRKGRSSKYWYEQKYNTHIKLYVEPCKELFESNVSYHNIGYIFQLIPYLDYGDNSINVDDALKVLNYNVKNKYRFINTLQQIPYITIEKNFITISKTLVNMMGYSTKNI
jgi:hypothetical protein